MTDELKPCSFCGGVPVVMTMYSGGGLSKFVACLNCHSGTSLSIVEWNTRPIEDALRARIEELEEAQQWIPVSERLPEEGKRVEIMFENGAVKIGHHWNVSKEWAADDGTFYHTASYSWVVSWRPLPQPPQDK